MAHTPHWLNRETIIIVIILTLDDFENFLSQLNRHVDFNLFAAQLGLSGQT